MVSSNQDSHYNPMKVIFNYQNVFFSFFYDDADACVHRSKEYAMNYVLSGEMVLDDGHRQVHVGEGECVFIPRDHRVTMYKKASDAPAVGYATVYPLTMFLRVLTAQLLILSLG